MGLQDKRGDQSLCRVCRGDVGTKVDEIGGADNYTSNGRGCQCKV